MRLATRRLFVCLCLLATSGIVVAQDSPQDLLKQQADEAYRQRSFVQSIELANQALASNPQDHVALYLRGSSRVEHGIVTGDVESIRQGIEDARQAIGNEGSGKPEYYLPYIYGMSHLAGIEGKTAHAQMARSVADSVLERQDLSSEQRANLLYQRAQANLQLKDNNAAESDLKQSLQLAPKHLAAHMLIADLTARTKSPSEAIAAYGRVVAAFPDNPVVYNNRGRFLQSQGRTADAVADYNKAIELDETFMPAFINRGFAYLENGDAATAESALTQVVEVDPTQSGALSLRGTARLNLNKSREAIEDYRKVAELAPRSPMSHADLGFVLFFTGDYAGALASFNKALQLDANLRFLHPWKLACEFRVNQADQKFYEASLNKPEGQRDWIDSLVLFQFNRIDYKQLLESVHPRDEKARHAQTCEAYYFIGLELQRRGRGKDALGYFQQATQRKLPSLSAYRGAVFALNNADSIAR